MSCETSAEQETLTFSGRGGSGLSARNLPLHWFDRELFGWVAHHLLDIILWNETFDGSMESAIFGQPFVAQARSDVFSQCCQTVEVWIRLCHCRRYWGVCMTIRTGEGVEPASNLEDVAVVLIDEVVFG